jgi:hypothetical protein
MEFSPEQIGMVAGLILILSAGAKGIWVWGWHYQEVKKERDELLALAMSGTILAEKSVDIIEDEKGTSSYSSRLG